MEIPSLGIGCSSLTITQRAGSGKGQTNTHRDVYHFRSYPVNHHVAVRLHPAGRMLRNVTCIWMAMNAPETLGCTEGRNDIGVQPAVCHRRLLLLSLF